MSSFDKIIYVTSTSVRYSGKRFALAEEFYFIGAWLSPAIMELLGKNVVLSALLWVQLNMYLLHKEKKD
jgi:hypothetical protein